MTFILAASIGWSSAVTCGSRPSINDSKAALSGERATCAFGRLPNRTSMAFTYSHLQDDVGE